MEDIEMSSASAEVIINLSYYILICYCKYLFIC